ncbi:MAG: translation initiation factor IF-2 [Chloroflexi bacterium]|nr:translation initiation factor IF-2 [Chloroflexota bacterium]
MKRNTRYNRSPRGGQQNNAARPAPQPRPEAPKAKSQPTSMEIELPPVITVRELADLMQRSPIDLIKELMNAGVMANINQQIDYDTAAIVAEDMGYQVIEHAEPEPEEEAPQEATPVVTRKRREYTDEEARQLRPRPPVVTILGHVDHGKTSLLDVIRQTSVQASEAGGITQHIGAYQVDVNGQRITFLDTPGHEAFTAMRARGASVTDIAVLVVAADDGVQPQTREAIDHARAAQVPIIVALNKIDLASANPDHVKQQLADLGLVAEDWGGETICVPVSARTKQGIGDLLDNILVVAEMSDIKANPRRNCEGVVVEGRLDRSRGATATLLVQEGTLQAGDSIVVGTTYGRIRAMFDYTGATLDKAGPSTPAVVIGLRDVPGAGDTFVAVENERKAREIAEQRAEEQHSKSAGSAARLSLEDVYSQAQAGKVHSLNLILKADVQGSLEPIRNSLQQIEIKDLSVSFVHEGVGTIAESDVMLAIASHAVIIGFSVGVDPSAERLAEAEGVDIRIYDIIYRVIEDVEKALTGMLEPEYREVLQGRAVVRQVFNISRVGLVAGAQISEGRGLRSASAKVMRDGNLIHQGRVSSLKRFTEDVREVTTGMECGIGVDGAKDIQADDVIEFYTRELVQ